MSSPAKQFPLFGRKYQVQVLIPNSDGTTQNALTITDSSAEPEALRVTFEIYQKAYQVYWYADISIYNLNQSTTQQLLNPSNLQQIEVVVSAGYVPPGNFQVIWRGPIFQTLFEREEGTDLKLTLHCILGPDLITRNTVNNTFPAGVTQQDIVEQIANQSFTKIPVDRLSTKLTKKLPRAKTVFGGPRKALTEIAEDNQMQWWLGGKGLNMGGMLDDDIPTESDITFSPPLLPVANVAGPALTAPVSGVIVDTPQQTQYGVSFRALLDPRVQVTKPYVLIKIDNSQLRKQKLFRPSTIIPILDMDGTYIVNGVRFVGDTRGNDWYVDIEACSTYLGKQELLQAITAG